MGKNRIGNTIIRKKIQIIFTMEKIVESCPMRSGHKWQRAIEALIRRVDQMKNNPKVKGKRRPRRTICQPLSVVSEV